MLLFLAERKLAWLSGRSVEVILPTTNCFPVQQEFRRTLPLLPSCFAALWQKPSTQSCDPNRHPSGNKLPFGLNLRFAAQITPFIRRLRHVSYQPGE
jgi:hypothetical protein